MKLHSRDRLQTPLFLQQNSIWGIALSGSCNLFLATTTTTTTTHSLLPYYSTLLSQQQHKPNSYIGIKHVIIIQHSLPSIFYHHYNHKKIRRKKTSNTLCGKVMTMMMKYVRQRIRRVASQQSNTGIYFISQHDCYVWVWVSQAKSRKVKGSK